MSFPCARRRCAIFYAVMASGTQNRYTNTRAWMNVHCTHRSSRRHRWERTLSENVVYCIWHSMRYVYNVYVSVWCCRVFFFRLMCVCVWVCYLHSLNRQIKWAREASLPSMLWLQFLHWRPSYVCNASPHIALCPYTKWKKCISVFERFRR